MKRTVPILLLLAGLPCASACFLQFSVDALSPITQTGLGPGDILVGGHAGVVVYQPGATLGLVGNANLDAFSRGFYDWRAFDLLFSVDRQSTGLPGSAVNARLATGTVAADVFAVTLPTGANRLCQSAASLSLGPGDNIDALEMGPGLMEAYFSVDRATAPPTAQDILFGAPFLPAHLYADGISQIGLRMGDDLDAMILVDVGGDGWLQPGVDMALFSISPDSPSAFTAGLGGWISPADILYTDFTGGFSLWASAGDIGLERTDNLDGLALDVPEPGAFYPLSVLAVGGLLCRRLRKGLAARKVPARHG